MRLPEKITIPIELELSCVPAKRKARFCWTVYFQGCSVTGDSIMLKQLKIALALGLSGVILLRPVDKDNNPVAIDGKPVWDLKPLDGIVDVVVADDGLSAHVKLVEPVNPDTIGKPLLFTVTGDANLGDLDEPIVQEIVITPEPAEAVTLGATFVPDLSPPPSV